MLIVQLRIQTGSHSQDETSREALADVQYYIPRNREEYLATHPEAQVPPKTQAAASANLAIRPMDVPESSLPPISPSPASIPATQVSPSQAPTQPPSTYQNDDDDDGEEMGTADNFLQMDWVGAGTKRTK